MKLLTTAEAAGIMRLSKSRVRQLCEEGSLPARRTCITKGHWRIDEEALIKMLSETTQPVSESVPKIEHEQIDYSIFKRAKELARG